MTTNPIRILLLLLLFSMQSEAAGPFYDEGADKIDYVGEDIPAWQEQSNALPPLPQKENLLLFDVGEIKRRFNYYIDATSIVVADDGVVRFSLVIESMSGVQNSSYEGIRCSTKEYKVYAYGSKDQFKAVRKAKWRNIILRTKYQMALFQHYLCDLQGAVLEPLPSEQAIKQIRAK